MSTFRITGLVLFTLGVLGLLALLVSCGGSSSSSSTVAKVVLVPTISSITINGQQAFTANALDASGNTVTGVTFTWASSAADVATVDTSGVATGIKGGSTEITATSSTGSVTSSPATLTVLPNVASVTISPTSASIKVGGQQQFTATAKDAAGNTVSGAVINWAVSFSGVATIDQNGLATGVSTGTALVTATSGGVTSPVATLNVTN
jgi:uncharacterized protein YjdB